VLCGRKDLNSSVILERWAQVAQPVSLRFSTVLPHRPNHH
jgi:hypothetical protein